MARPAKPVPAFVAELVGGTIGSLLALGPQAVLVPQLVPKLVPIAPADDDGAGVGYDGAPLGVGAPRPTEQVVEPETVMVEVVIWT